MLLPTTAKNNLETFQRQFGHQRERRIQFKLSGHDLALFSEVSTALSRLLHNRFSEAEHLVQLRSEFEQFDSKVAFTDHKCSELGFGRLDLPYHARAELKLQEFVSSEPRLAKAQVGPFGHVFTDPELEGIRLSVSKCWDEAQVSSPI